MQQSFQQTVPSFYAEFNGRRYPVGMGCAWIGQGGDQSTLHLYDATLDAAYETGYRYFDTSAMYGGSEFRVGRFVKRVGSNDLFLATKTPIPEALSPAEAALYVRQALHNSLERLGVASLDLFQIHDVASLSQVLAAEGAIEVLLEARCEGLIRYFGLATRFHDLLEIASEHPAFDTVLTYLDYTLLNQTAGWLIEKAASVGKGVISASPLAFGLLTGSDPKDDSRTSGEFRQYRGYASKLFDYCRTNGLEITALALQYPMRHPNISITLTGPASPQEVSDGVRAITTPIPLEVWNTLHTNFQIPMPTHPRNLTSC